MKIPTLLIWSIWNWTTEVWPWFNFCCGGFCCCCGGFCFGDLPAFGGFALSAGFALSDGFAFLSKRTGRWTSYTSFSQGRSFLGGMTSSNPSGPELFDAYLWHMNRYCGFSDVTIKKNDVPHNHLETVKVPSTQKAMGLVEWK